MGPALSPEPVEGFARDDDRMGWATSAEASAERAGGFIRRLTEQSRSATTSAQVAFDLRSVEQLESRRDFVWLAGGFIRRHGR